MLPFIRSDLAQLTAYVPHPGGAESAPDPSVPLDRLDTNESPYDLPDDLKQTLSHCFQKEIEANRYPDGSHAPLKAAIAAYVTESANLAPDVITPQHLSVGNGSDELIRSLLIATCLNGNGSILVATPTFSMYAILANTLGIPVVTVGRSEQNFEVDLDAAQMAIVQSADPTQTDLPPIRVVCMVHPNSPTANALTSAELDWLRSLPHDVLVMIDEAYFEFSQTTVVSELEQHPNWVILRTFSKAFRLASLRVGYAIAHPDLIAILEKTRLPYNLPSFSQAGALLALEHSHELQTVIPILQRERQKLFQVLSAIPALHVWRSDANFLYLRLQPCAENPWRDRDPEAALEAFFHQLKRAGTLVRHTGGGIRLTVGTPEENQRTLSRIRQVFNMDNPL